MTKLPSRVDPEILTSSTRRTASPIPMRIDPDLIDNQEDPRAAKKDREAARQILRDQANR